MGRENITKQIYELLENQGWKGKMVPIEHIKDLQSEIVAKYENGLLDRNMYVEYLADFDFNISDYFSEAKALIVVTAPQPQVRVTFRLQDRIFPCIIPPTYSHTTDGQIKDALEKLLKPKGYHLEKKRLPEKLLAVRSGLARYGKNNITYVPGMGSFHRPVVFLADLPSQDDNWRDLDVLKSCDGCTACMEACPSGAITSDRFLIYAQRCITFHNERKGDFPSWLDSAWHNCLIGCMYCQNACPVNTKAVNWIEDAASLSEEETASLLQAVPKDNTPQSVIDKLMRLDIIEYAGVLGRNLNALIKRQSQFSVTEPS